MRLQAVRDGTVYASDGRDVLVRDPGGQFERVGRLPLPDTGRDRLVYRVLTSKRWRPVVHRLVGAVSTVNVWPLSTTDLLATVGRRLFVSGDRGRSWEPSRRLPPSSGPMGVLPSAVEHHDGTTYLGEYPLRDGATPRVLVSRDRGRSWATHAALPDVRHVHAVQRDPCSGDVWVTTGDADAESRIGRLRSGALEAVGGGSQAWRAVELAFTPSALLWGMDCAYADENRIFKLPREEFDAPDPTPEAVGRVPGSVYYGASLPADGDQWVAFSTAMEAGRDSTGPATQEVPHGRGVVVAASSSSGYADWHELAVFRRRRVLADRLPGGLPRANGYVFLGADPGRGLFVNPYNTATDGGTIRQFAPERFAQIAGRRPVENSPDSQLK
jgi:hypothetical protein